MCRGARADAARRRGRRGRGRHDGVGLFGDRPGAVGVRRLHGEGVAGAVRQPADGRARRRRRPGDRRRRLRGRADVGRDRVLGDRPAARRRAPFDRRRPGAFRRGDVADRTRHRRGKEVDVDPVVGRFVGAGREGARRAVAVHAVCAGGVGERLQRGVLDGAGEARGGVGVVPFGRQVGGDIGGVGVDRDGGGEVDLLPARGRFAGEGRRGEQRPARAPQAADVGAGVGGGLVEADARHRAGQFGGELHAELDRVPVAGVDRRRRGRSRRSCPAA